MNAFQLRSALALLALTLATIRAPAASDAFALLHSLYNPGTNAQLGTLQGTCVAVDGDFAVVGAPSDDIGGQDSGVVNQIAENSERRGFDMTQRQVDRVAYAKAHTKMFCANDSDRTISRHDVALFSSR